MISSTANLRHRLHRDSPFSATKQGEMLKATGERARLHRCRDIRSEEHTSELQSLTNLVCRLLLEKKKKHTIIYLLIIVLLYKTIKYHTLTLSVTTTYYLYLQS